MNTNNKHLIAERNNSGTAFLVEANNLSRAEKVMIAITKKMDRLNKPGGIFHSLRLFFGLSTKTYKKSRIIRRHNKSFEDFIFKGYDQQRPDLSRSGSFKKIKMLCKN